MQCFICKKEVEATQTINTVTCNCPDCGNYMYEKNFLTTYNYYCSINSSERINKINDFLKDYVKAHNVCFVDDYETSRVEDHELKEFRDILNMVGLEVTHNNTIDSNYKD